MIAKGNTHHSGARLADYFLKAKPGERIEIGEIRGFVSEDIRDALRAVDAMAIGTNCQKPMFHGQVRLRDGEKLTREQWQYVADRIETKLGLAGQPRAMVFHISAQTGDAHMHVGWSRIDEQKMTAKSLAFFKLRLKEVSRELETELGITPVRNHRERPEMAANRNEDQQARRLGVDIHDVRRKIRECWERSDNGHSFEAALADDGLTLAQGDRRDFVVVDHEGGTHAIGKRILGSTAAEVRARCSDLDRDGLPTVVQAREQMRHGIRDIHAASLAWEHAIAEVTAVQRRQAHGLSQSVEGYTGIVPDLLAILTKNRATFTRRDIERALEPEIDDESTRTTVTIQILAHAEVVTLGSKDGPRTRYTTKTVLETEHHVLTAAAALGRNDRHAVVAKFKSEKFGTLTGEQERAVAHASGPSALAIIEGQAGTGKSYTMSAIREVYEANGYRVVGLAPTNAVAQDMKDDGFRQARTIHSEIFAVNNGRARWTARTVVMLDEAAMVNTRILSQVAAHANNTGAKLILIGDDRQLSSIEYGGMFEVLKERHGAAKLTEVRRQCEREDRSASELMSQGKFAEALRLYEAKNAIHWSTQQSGAADALVNKWAQDSAADPSKSRFVFAYTNSDVTELNSALREVREKRGELGCSCSLETKHGAAEFAAGDRIQFTGTDKRRGLFNGQAGTVRGIEGNRVTVALDGRSARTVEFDAAEFRDFRHGYAGTIYKGQGRTIDVTYLYHSEHWRRSSSYVAMTRHSEQAELFAAHETAADLHELARQMARRDEQRAASSFIEARQTEHEKPLTPVELNEWYARTDRDGHQHVRDAAKAQAVSQAARCVPELMSQPARELRATTEIDSVHGRATHWPDFAAKLDRQGIHLAVVTNLDSHHSGGLYREGEIVTVSRTGQVHTLGESVIGRNRPMMESLLASVDRTKLPGIEATQERINLDVRRHIELSQVGVLIHPNPARANASEAQDAGKLVRPDWRRRLRDPGYPSEIERGDEPRQLQDNEPARPKRPSRGLER